MGPLAWSLCPHPLYPFPALNANFIADKSFQNLFCISICRVALHGLLPCRPANCITSWQAARSAEPPEGAPRESCSAIVSPLRHSKSPRRRFGFPHRETLDACSMRTPSERIAALWLHCSAFYVIVLRRVAESLICRALPASWRIGQQRGDMAISAIRLRPRSRRAPRRLATLPRLALAFVPNRLT